jgi:hypothetical protein
MRSHNIGSIDKETCYEETEDSKHGMGCSTKPGTTRFLFHMARTGAHNQEGKKVMTRDCKQCNQAFVPTMDDATGIQIWCSRCNDKYVQMLTELQAECNRAYEANEAKKLATRLYYRELAARRKANTDGMATTKENDNL